MLKTAIGVIVGFFVFFAVVYGVGFVMRMSWPAYAAVAEALAFTTPMLLARLGIGVVASLAAGRVAAMLAPQPNAAALALGILLVVFFAPVHMLLWSNFPLWYHLFFLLSLIPLTAAGARIGRPRNPIDAGASPA